MKQKNSIQTMLILGIVASLLLALIGTTEISNASPVVLYAKPSSTGSGSCTSWGDACDLQAALASANSGDEIWVAEGMHVPTDGSDRNQSFYLNTGIAIYGGFVGTETSRELRDWELYETILSGDIGRSADNSDNSFHVVIGSGTDSTAILDGFTISSGNANADPGNGGGMVNVGGSPTLLNLTFSSNQAGGHGGAMYNENSSPMLENCQFVENAADSDGDGSGDGGGMYNEGNSSPVVSGVFFLGNTANYGGGMHNGNGSNPKLTNVIFSGNSATGDGGGMHNYPNSSPELTNVVFFGNAAGNDGGGISNGESNPTLTNVTFSGNTAANRGGGIYNWKSSPELRNCILWGDTNGEIFNGDSDSTPVVTYSDIQGSYPGEGNIDADPLFVDASVGDLHLQQGSSVVDAGNNEYVIVATDLDGLPRVGSTGLVDMGAYEFQFPQPPGPIYVDVNASGANDGSSWENAFSDLQDGLDAATVGSSIWVAVGTYTPSTKYGGTNERNRSFQLRNGVALYGGFDPSVGDDAWEERDWVNNVTTLSGDIGTAGVAADNSYHVFYHPLGTGLNSTAILDGFTISGGNANVDSGNGGGMVNVGGSPTLRNLTFSSNQAGWHGGAMYNENSSPTLTNCQFVNNVADDDGDGGGDGGGMYNEGNSSPVVSSVFFLGNTANYGGGMHNGNGSNPKLTNVIFSGNSATGDGGGMHNYPNSSPELTNVVFFSNAAGNDGGGISNGESNPTLTNVTFSGNTAANRGGGIYNWKSSPELRNCILWGDTNGEIFNGDSDSTPVVSYSDIHGSYPGEGNIDADPLFVDASVGDLHLQQGSSAVDAGNNEYVIVATDLDGLPRFGFTGLVDMGAYEFQFSPIYVDADASGANDGSSWENAYTDLQEGLDDATAGDEIWVATGTYTPGSERTDTFQLKDGVALYGGFAGGETSLELRDWETNETILSGDIGMPMVDEDNSYHIVRASGVQADSILDGFTITGGYADAYPHDRGGGMYISGGSPTVGNVTFINNFAMWGGGMYISSGNPELTDCMFSGNRANYYGGGMSLVNSSSPTLTGCTFQDNNSANVGGGMHNNNASPELSNCSFSGNSAIYSGGGMYNVNNSSPAMTNCVFSGNWVSGSGGGYGGGMYNLASSPVLTNCTFSENWSDTGGGGMSNWSASPVLTNCAFVGNSTTGSGGGSGMWNHESAPVLTNCTFSGNSSAGSGGGMRNTNSSPVLTNCTFWGNSATGGGGMWNSNSASLTLTNSILWGDTPNEVFNADIENSPVVTYSDIQGGYEGVGNIDADPLFVDADGSDDTPGTADDDLRLQLLSPAIDVGDNSAVPEGVTTDLEGNPRIDNDTVDLGAYEAQQNNKPTAEFRVKDALVEGSNSEYDFQLILGGEPMLFTGKGRDTDGSIVAYEWKSSTSPEPLSTDLEFSLTDELPIGEHTISFRVQDDDGAWSKVISTRIIVRQTPVVYVEGYQIFEYGIPQAEHYYDLLDPQGSRYSCNVLIHSGTGDIRDAAARLGKEIQALKNATHARKVDIASHSMGGLISRWYMQMLNGDDVRRFVSVGSPHHGLDWMYLSSVPLLDIIINQAGPQMRPHSVFLNDLNKNDKCATWGDGTDYINPKTQYIVIAAKGIITPEHRHFEIGWLGIRFKYPWFPRNGDFTVSADSSRLDGVPFLTAPSFASQWHWDLDEPDKQPELWDCVSAIFHSSTNDIPAGCATLNPSVQGLLSEISFDEATTTEIPAAIQWAEPISGVIAAGGSNSHTSHLDAAAQRVIFQLLAPCELGLNLSSPSGQVFDPSYPGYSSEPGQILYEIPSPESGDWTLNLSSSQPDECEYSIQTLSETTLMVGVGTDKDQYKPSDPIIVFAYAQDAGVPLPGASITTRILRPGGVQELLTLWDDGTHGDALADDGLYVNVYENTAENGIYGIEILAQIIKDGVMYTRNADTSVSVALSPDLAIADSDITLSNVNPPHGETINIAAAIHNTGDADAQAAKILFYNGDPGESGEQIGEATVDVPVGSTTTASLAWPALRGAHTIHVIVSPFNDFLEISYDNNRAQTTVIVSDTVPPTAIAGPNQTVLVGTPVFFDGSLSTDNAGITEYHWDVDTSLDSSRDDIPDNDVDLMGDTPVLQGGYGTPGDYVVQLSVKDADGNGPNNDILTVHVTTEPDTEPPEANAGEDIGAKLKQPIFFDASQSMDNFAIASYQWDTDIAVDTDHDGIPDNDRDLIGVNPTLTSGYNRSGTYTVKLVVDDVAGNGPAEDLLVVTVLNRTPTAQAGGPYLVDENAFATFDATGSSDPDSDELRYRWDFDNDGQWDSEWSDLPWAYYAWPDDYAGMVRIEVSDGDLSSVDTADVTVNNVAPKATLSLVISANEGEEFTISLVNSLDASTVDTQAGFIYSFDCGEGSGYGDFSMDNSTNCPTEDNGLRVVKGKIRDKDGGEAEYTATVEIYNVAPTVGPITLDQNLISVGTSITANADFTDPGTADIHTAVWDWSDGTTPGTVTQGTGYGSITDSYTYYEPGVFTISLTVTDDDGGASTSVSQFVVVYDPDDGFVTGGGWIYSDPGAYIPDPSLEGEADFGFVSKYRKDDTVPIGNTEFQFKVGDLYFQSTSYDWLVVTGSDYARFKGTGTINGSGEYKFMLWAGDKDPDTFRIRIWTEDELGVETDIYDNGFDQAIGGGSIVIHTKNY